MNRDQLSFEREEQVPRSPDSLDVNLDSRRGVGALDCDDKKKRRGELPKRSRERGSSTHRWEFEPRESLRLQPTQLSPVDSPGS